MLNKPVSLPIFVADGSFSSLFRSISFNVVMKFTDTHWAQSEPNSQSVNVDQILGRDPQSIHDEESAQEVKSDNNEQSNETSESSMTNKGFRMGVWGIILLVKDVPFFYAFLSFATKPIEFSKASLSDEEHTLKIQRYLKWKELTKHDTRGVRAQDITDDVIPPAFSEMRKDVLPGEFYYTLD